MLESRLGVISVIGSGTMGAQIACLFATAGISVNLFDLSTVDVKAALQKLKKMDPSPLGHPETLDRITPRNLDLVEDLEVLRKSDWVIEAILEKLEIKQALFKKIVPYLKSSAVLASNTSGLSINAMAEQLPEIWKQRFCGMHFFNPPRYLPLVELIPSDKTDQNLLDQIEIFLVRFLGKKVIRAKDTPNFIANRLGIFSLAVTMHYAEFFKIPLEIADELTGKLLGRPKSATFRTGDIVGLDVIGHVLATSKNGFPNCAFRALYDLPSWVNDLIKLGALGQKVGKGFYQKKSDGLYVYDLDLKNYRLIDRNKDKNLKIDSEILKIFENKNWGERFKNLSQLAQLDHPQAKFLWAIFRELFIYAAKTSEQIEARQDQIDTALKAGFGWKKGPFEIWRSAGWKEVLDWIEIDQKAKKVLTDAQLPEWVFKSEGLDKLKNNFKNLFVYARQISPAGKIIFENEGLVLTREDNDLGVVSFKTKMGTISSKVLDGLLESISLAEKELQGLVIYQKDHENFSVGADLMEAGEKFLMEGPEALNAHLEKFQQASLRLRYSQIPVVAAVRGFAFGGGCEFLLHSDAVVAAQESYIGLVEVGVGLIPGAGGSKEFALRSAKSLDPHKAFQENFKTLAMAGVGKGAYWARAMGFLKDSDSVIANPEEILFVAKKKVLYLADSNYQMPLSEKFQVQGREGRALVRMFLSNMKAGKKISEYDYYLADQLAYVMTGGDLDQGSWVDESWILKLEREVFLKLVEQEKTFERIDHMLKTGKPLRN